MVITVLQDHTLFMARMLGCALNDTDGRPLNLQVLHEVTHRMLVTKYRGRLRTLRQLRLEATSAGPSEKRKIEIMAASAVEGEIEAWYCVANDDGLEWLKQNQPGPIIHWGNAWWWGKLKGIKIDAKIEFYGADI